MITSADEFVRLRLSEDPAEYWKASHDTAPLDVWLAIIDGFPEMREWVVHNKTAPVSILKALLADPNPAVRTAVAMKRKMDSRSLITLSGDEDAGVRHAVALNPRCPPHVLVHLGKDKEGFVAQAARKRLSIG